MKCNRFCSQLILKYEEDDLGVIVKADNYYCARYNVSLGKEDIRCPECVAKYKGVKNKD